MEQLFDQAVATVLRGKQAENRVSNIALTDATGIPERTLIRYMQGQRPIPLSRMVAIASAIGVDAGDVVRAAIEAVQVAEEQARI